MARTVSVCDPTPLLVSGGRWDNLLSRSHVDTVFMTSAWLRAVWQVEGRVQGGFAVVAHSGGELMAGMILVRRERHLEFLGTGSSDYLDIVVDSSLSEEETGSCIHELLAKALKAVPTARALILRNLRQECETPGRLESLSGGLWVTQLRTAEAPTMSIGAADQALRKRSLVRHEKRLTKLGLLRTLALSRADDVSPRLSDFFEQHVRRWQGTGTVSQFHDPRQRELYQQLAANLGDSGWLRYTEIQLDGRSIAAHFGACYGGRFYWYKPSYDPKFARFSPGEVLLKRLIEQAVTEGVEEFDFTIGGEAFKKRFATEIRTVSDLHITRSASWALALRAKLASRRHLRSALMLAGVWEHIGRIHSRYRQHIEDIGGGPRAPSKAPAAIELGAAMQLTDSMRQHAGCDVQHPMHLVRTVPMAGEVPPGRGAVLCLLPGWRSPPHMGFADCE